MATSLRLFQTYPARPTFGENIKVQNARDYILNKSAKTSFCNAKYCDPLKKTIGSSQGDLLLLRKTKNLNYYKSLIKNLNPNNPNNSNETNNQSFINLNYISDRIPTYYFNKSNLNVNLITKLDLKGVKVIENNLTGQTPTSIVLNPSSGIPYYNNYNIDPDGLLFGNTTCGINNYEKFMLYNPPYISTTSNHIDSL